MSPSLDLSSYATAFIGRERELTELGGLLASGARLVTIVGPGGVGKTRLAVHLASSTRDVASDLRACFCDLSDARDLDTACAAVARTLDVPLSSGDSEAALATLGRALAERGPTLLVLDNFEQLVEHGPRMLVGWLAAARDARIVVTSRTRLRLPAESCFELHPLELPAEDEADLESIAANSAVRLFVERARLGRSSFVLAPSDARAAAAIVRQLDGMPLAIELCAVRASMLGVEQLLDLMPRQLDVLGGADRTSPARHATLRRAIDWSWDQLTKAERAALTACSVFRGGWDLAAAESVVGEGAVDLLQALHDKSLVRSYEPHAASRERRYGLYESIRSYASERLAASGEDDAVRRRHAVHFLAAYGGLEPPDLARDEVKWRRRLLLDTGNLEAIYEAGAPARQERTPEAAAQALEALLALGPVFSTRGPLDRYGWLLRDAVSARDAHLLPKALLGRALAQRGWVHHLRGRNDEAATDLTRAGELADEASDVATFTFALGKRGCAATVMGDLVGARACFDSALGHITRSRVPLRVEAQLLRDRAFFYSTQGLSEESRRDLEASLVLFRASGARRDEGLVLSELASRMLELGDLDRAATHNEAALAVIREVGDRRVEATALIGAGAIAREQNDPERARATLESALDILASMGDPLQSAIASVAHEQLGVIELFAGHYERARTHLARAEDLARSSGRVSREAAVCMAADAVALAHVGDTAAAAARIDRASAELAHAAHPTDGELIALYRAHLDILAARDEVATGDAAGAARRLDRVRALATSETPTTDPDEVRFARALLNRELRATPSQRLVLAGSGSWFMLGDERVSLGQRAALKNLVLGLARQHAANPGVPLLMSDLFALGWPGVSVRPTAGINRVKVALTTLRNLGLRDALQTHDGGYRLSPDLTIRVDSAE